MKRSRINSTMLFALVVGSVIGAFWPAALITAVYCAVKYAFFTGLTAKVAVSAFLTSWAVLAGVMSATLVGTARLR